MVLPIMLDVFIAVAAVLAWISVVLGRGDDLNLMTHGLASLKYYTVLSNLFSGAASVAHAGCLLLGGMPAGAGILTLKLAGASVVMVTFLTVVIFLGPTMGWTYMFKAGNFWLHLVLPLAAAADVCLLVPVGTLPWPATLAPVAFTAAYGAWYVFRVLRYGRERDGKVYDFYGFVRWGRRGIAVVAAIMLAGTWAISWLLWVVSGLVM